jgi:hypothetical protein
VFEDMVKEKIAIHPLPGTGKTFEERWLNVSPQAPIETSRIQYDTCSWCVRIGGEFVAAEGKKEWFDFSPNDSGRGACCRPGDYSKYTSCDLTDVSYYQ